MAKHRTADLPFPPADPTAPRNISDLDGLGRMLIAAASSNRCQYQRVDPRASRAVSRELKNV